MPGDRWGVTAAEVARRYPCDDLAPAPIAQAWRGVTVQASPERVWAWVVQLRLAPYSYDWIDNLGRRSPQHLLPVVPPRPGTPFTAAFGRPQGRVVSIEPGVQLTGRILGALMSYVLVPDGDATRLLLKVVLLRGRAIAPAVVLGDLVMARRQLLNLKRLAQGSGG
jgi:hypothetical protein